MKLPAGPLKVIFVSRAALAENRDRAVVRDAKFIPPWVVFVRYPEGEKDGVTVPAKTECFAAHSFKAKGALTPRADYRTNRPYTWIPSVRPGYPNESLTGANVWLETWDELVIETKDKING